MSDFLAELSIQGQSFHYYSLKQFAKQHKLTQFEQLPFTLKVLAENLCRHLGEKGITEEDLKALNQWVAQGTISHEVAYHPSRVLMQDFTGVPAVVDLAAMRDAMAAQGGDVEKINPLCPVDLVIDHSVQVGEFGSKTAYEQNVNTEMLKNRERYQFLKWGQKSFDHFRVVPPGVGICHQVNLEHLAPVVWAKEVQGQKLLYPDTVVGTDSHTTMINGLGVLGWGVGGIEAEAAMLGQPISMLIPDVVGFELTGRLQEGVTATDCVLLIVQMLRQQGVVGKFVEFYGEGLSALSLAERATIANMAPEYGATCGFFPIDQETLNYLDLTGRSAEQVARVEAYAKAQGLWYDPSQPAAKYTAQLQLDLDQVAPCVAGPKRPQDRVLLADLPQATAEVIADKSGQPGPDLPAATDEASHQLTHGDVVIAAITSCTNTSNPSVLIAAGLLAKAAIERGLAVKPWVKTSLAPGSRVVMDYLERCDLVKPLEALGFHLVGYGCTTCIGNSGPLPEDVGQAIDDNKLVVCSVLSGNRNFEGRVHPQVQANWLASPPLVVAYALAGTTRLDLTQQALGHDEQGQPVYLKDLWPSKQAIQEAMSHIERELFVQRYQQAFEGDRTWQMLQVDEKPVYDWNASSTYIQCPPFFKNKVADQAQDIVGARLLALLGDSVTTDHISPAGSIAPNSPAAQYLKANGVDEVDFNSYGSRRGNHEVMMRGTFANVRICNEMVPGIEGGMSRIHNQEAALPIYDVAMHYASQGTASIVVAGKEYGTGSSRDWAAKGPALLGVKAVVAESYERIHRSNLIGMGVLPLQFQEGITRQSLELCGDERFDLIGVAAMDGPSCEVQWVIHRADGSQTEVQLLCRIDTENELEYYRNGGILQTVLKQAV